MVPPGLKQHLFYTLYTFLNVLYSTFHLRNAVYFKWRTGQHTDINLTLQKLHGLNHFSIMKHNGEKYLQFQEKGQDCNFQAFFLSL